MRARTGPIGWVVVSAAACFAGCSTIAAGPDGSAGADVADVVGDARGADASAPDVPHIGPGGNDAAADVARTPEGGADAARDVANDVPTDTGPSCDSTCAPHAHCVQGVCQCDPYFASQGTSCVPTAPGDPASRTDADLCNGLSASGWSGSGRFVPGTGGTCDPGSLDRGALDETLATLNMFRWLVGLSPVSDDAACNAQDQQCAMMESMRGQPDGTYDPHHPSSDWACYSADGAHAASTSNIAWGVNSAAESIGLYIDDPYNEATMGHRRWALNTTLGNVGIGYYSGASCLGVFGCSSDLGFEPVTPPWHAYPPPGPVPVWTTYGVWTFHAYGYQIQSDATVTMTRASDGSSLPVTVTLLPGGYGDATLSWQPMGWSPAVGDSYHVNVTGLAVGGSSVAYDVRVISCP